MDDTSPDAYQVEVNEDDWHDVTDAKKRKQIQDRLAQRARRKRLREAKKNAKQTLQGGETQSSHDTQLVNHCYRTSDATDRLISPDLDAFDLTPCSEDVTLPSSPRTLSFDAAFIGQAPTMSHELSYPPTVYGALFINGQILGLLCSASSPARSLPASSDVPVPLRPTPTQLLTLHCPALDRFPFPKMRDNAINLGFLVDEEQFFLDLFTMPSFEITAGATSWDPRAWKIQKPFADKWGFLFY